MDATAIATISVIFGGLTIVVNILVLSIGGTWKISELKASLVKEIHSSKQEIEAAHDKYVHDVGETFAAFRQKISDVEMYIRDNYVRRDSFVEVNRQTQDTIRGAVEDLKQRLERMENKIDTKT